MWGCSDKTFLAQWRNGVFPTHVGVFRPSALTAWAYLSFSPRMWGCSWELVQHYSNRIVFPTHVGVFRLSAAPFDIFPCFPHACGGVPVTASCNAWRSWFSPRMWGCSGTWPPDPGALVVFPTHVGVFRIVVVTCSFPFSFPHTVGVGRNGMNLYLLIRSFPHACGGVPPVEAIGFAGSTFSPRMWGCSARRLRQRCRPEVFPTHVGVFRRGNTPDPKQPGFPHACGGVPNTRRQWQGRNAFSPRMWGCSEQRHICFNFCWVSPTHVGCSLDKLGYRTVSVRLSAHAEVLSNRPHACGGVPLNVLYAPALMLFSPRMWGCSLFSFWLNLFALVFPTHVGVFRGVRDEQTNDFPHACGGVPVDLVTGQILETFSPRMWGCSDLYSALIGGQSVFPTHVGVFRGHIVPPPVVFPTHVGVFRPPAR